MASIIGYVELTETGLLIRESLGGGFAILGIVALGGYDLPVLRYLACGWCVGTPYGDRGTRHDG